MAIFQGGWALDQLWFFWAMPIIGGIIYRYLWSDQEALPDIRGDQV